MKLGRSFTDLFVEVQRQNETKRDFLADTRTIRATLAEADGVVSPLITLDGTSHLFGIAESAHRQIGTSLEIPAKYYDKMRRELPDLLVDSINRWFDQAPCTRLLRTLDGKTRAFLSNRYRCIDNLEVLSALLPIIMNMGPDVQVQSCEVTESRMYLKVVNPKLQLDVAPGDIVQAGVVISNSEIGFGAVNVQPLIYRLVCSNGMTVNDAAARKYHVGRAGTADESYQLYSDATLAQDDKAFIMKMQDTVRAAVDEARFATVVNIMRGAKDAKVTGSSIPAVIELTAKEYKLSEAEADGVLMTFIKNQDLSLYGVANAITEHSQAVENYDRATELESLGYSVLTMAPDVWRRINSSPALLSAA